MARTSATAALIPLASGRRPCGGLVRVRGALPARLPGLAAVAAALLFPFVISGNQDLLDASIQTLAYVIMALGLNIVVGFR